MLLRKQTGEKPVLTQLESESWPQGNVKGKKCSGILFFLVQKKILQIIQSTVTDFK